MKHYLKQKKGKEKGLRETLLFYASNVTIGTKDNKDGTMGSTDTITST